MAEPPSTSPAAGRNLPVWLRAVVWLLAGLALISTAWMLLSGEAIVGNAHQRNFRELDVAARGLESWPDSLHNLARAQFLSGNVKPATSSQLQDGWTYRVDIEHPALGHYELLYSVVPDTAACAALRRNIEAGEKMRLPFIASNRVGEGPQLKIIDGIALSELWHVDHAEGLNLPDGTIGIDGITATGAPGGNAAAWPASSILCYGTVVPIGRLLGLDRSGVRFSNFMIVDGDHHIVRQLGESPLPVDSLDRLIPEDSALNVAFSTTMPGAKPTTGDKPARLADALEPVSLTIARRAYLGYVRPFSLPPGVTGCEPTAKTQTAVSLSLVVGGRPAAVPVPNASDPAPKVLAEVAGSPPAPPPCFLVGLVPRDALWRSALEVPQLSGTAFLIVFVLILALVPTIQLLMIGSGEAISRLSAIFVVLGLVFAVGVATLALCFAIDLARDRSADRVLGQTVATRMARNASAEIAERLWFATVQEKAYGEELGRGHATSVILPQPIDPRGDAVSREVSLGDAIPIIETLSLFGPNGRALPCGGRTLQFRGGAGSRGDIKGREYFGRLVDSDFDGTVDDTARGYVIDQVRSQTDGINKTILAVAPAATSGGGACAPAALVATAVLPSFIAPVLPPPLAFAVVDGRNALRGTIPVLFHSQAERSGAETLAAEVDRDGLAAFRSWLLTRSVSDLTLEFSADSDGHSRQFAAAAIVGTPWFVLVSHSDDAVDVTAARAARLALGNWVSWCATAPALIWLIWLFLRRTDRSPDWKGLWPHEQKGHPYRARAKRLAQIAGVAALVLIFCDAVDFSVGPVVVAVLTVIVAGIVIAGGMSATVTSDPLRATTERDFRRMAAAAALCLAVVPALAIADDARQFAIDGRVAEAAAGLASPAGAVVRWRDEIQRIARSFLTVPRQFARLSSDCNASTACSAGVRVEEGDRAAMAAPQRATLAGTFARWSGEVPTMRHLCGRSAAPGNLVRLCVNSEDAALSNAGVAVQRSPFLPGDDDWLGRTVVLASFAALAIGLWGLLGKVLRTLAGFGIPLEAITRPNLYIGDPSMGPPPVEVATVLPPRALIVGPPPALREHFLSVRSGYRAVDLAASDFPELAETDRRIVAYGLQLVLSDGKRRRVALERLETCDRHVRDFPDGTMVIMSTLSPIERILDAYERDRDDPVESQKLAKYREQLRWSLLLEKFATFTFKAIDNYDPTNPVPGVVAMLADVEVQLKASDPAGVKDKIAIIRIMLREIRWLPPQVVASAIGTDIMPQVLDDAARAVTAGVGSAGVFPIADVHYQRVVGPLVIAWARRLDPASAQAAVDYLRSAIIEHYQQCWSASTLSERVVLDHIAHDRFINIERSFISLTSLVRRGLVVLDPVPRLMNESFRMFVRQAERPERIREWRALQPVGAWANARLPLLIGLPVAALLLVGAAVWSGVELTVVLPLLLAGAPALVSQLTQAVRQPSK